MLNPTGGKQRTQDIHGSGHYGAGRGGRVHRGIDYRCAPGQPVIAPIGGRIERVSRPYANEPYSGVVLVNEKMTIKMWYFKPHDFLIAKDVFQGKEIGTAQDISWKYPGIQAHVHLEIDHIDPDLFMCL